MPRLCEPWPGNRNAIGDEFVIDVMISWTNGQGYRERAAALPKPASSFSIFSLIPLSANSEATRIAFLMAFAFDDPWVMKHAPFTPSNGAPPYSVWSSRFLKSENALRESRYPTCRVIVAFSDSLSVWRTRFARPSE